MLFNISLYMMPGEILFITGGNGSGTFTLLKAIYSLVPAWNADAEIVFRPNPDGLILDTRQPTLNLRNGVAYLSQKNAAFDDLPVKDNLRLAGHTLRDGKEFAAQLRNGLSVSRLAGHENESRGRQVWPLVFVSKGRSAA